MKTFFCLTKAHVPPGEWTQDLIVGKPVEVPAGGDHCLDTNWIYQTWALLISSGTPCYAIVQRPSTEGIIIALSIAASSALKMPHAPFFVDVVADGSPHPGAHLHIVQNRAHAKKLPNAIFMPHWSQPGLIPRDPQRGNRFEHLCFYGHSKNLAKELQTARWLQRLQDELGIQLHFPPVEHWHDYSQTDCVIAVRDFSRSPHWNKPATKLYNAWLAGVPFIGGRDSAYKADGRPGIDYLVATSPEEVFEHLRHLKADTSFRSQLVINGSVAAKNFTREAILERWRELVEKTIPALALQWKGKTKQQRSVFALHQKIKLFLERHSWSHLFRPPTYPSLEMNVQMKTFFGLTKEHIPPEEWTNDLIAGKPVEVPAGGGRCLNVNWLYQTWALLSSSGTPCYTLLEQLSTEDIIIALSIAASSVLKMPHALFFVDVVADDSPHPGAHLHIVQNRAHAKKLPNAIFMPHWSQPGLIPRDPQRGNRFEHLYFYGHSKNLAKELQTARWLQRLQDELGIQLHFPPVEHWHDYSQTDCVIAVRDFSRSPHWNKPATKLYNAWLAGVPFIGGRDSAYKADGRPGIDYLVATSPEEVFEHLRHLKADTSFRSQLVINGSVAAKNFTREAILERWRELVEKTIPALALQWKGKTKHQRSVFALHQKIKLFLERHSWSHLFRPPTYPSLEINFVLWPPSRPSPEWMQAWDEGKLVSLQESTNCVTSYSWIYQTWSLLQQSDTPCNLLEALPVSDVAIFLSMSLAQTHKSSIKPNLFLVDIVADGTPHPGAHLHIVQNRAHAKKLPNAIFMPHWPQPYLIPRNPDRGDRFENVCFLGDPQQLALEFVFPSWSERLKKELQLHFQIKTADQWHDYSDVDVVLAIRDISSARYLDKPSTKLYNAWHAGVPFIGGLDSAYAADGRPGVDYLVASSVEEAFQHLRRLKEDTLFRHQLVLNGTESGKAFTREATLQQWRCFLLETLPKLVKQWQKKSALQRSFFVITQRFFCFLDRYLH